MESSLLFKCVPKKEVTEWDTNLYKIGGIKLGTKGVKINWLASSYDLALLTTNWNEAGQQMSVLEK